MQLQLSDGAQPHNQHDAPDDVSRDVSDNMQVQLSDGAEQQSQYQYIVEDEVECDIPVEQRKKHVNDRTYRMCRRRRLALRREMLAFGSPPPVNVFTRIRLLPDFSDEESLNLSDVEHDSDKDSPAEVLPSEPTPYAQQKTSRKRKRDEASWKRNKIKRAREAGLGYTNYRGKHVARKKPRLVETLCREKCRYQCSEKVDDSQRRKIFSSFYSLTSNGQDVYLFGCIESEAPRLALNAANKHRDVSVRYTVSTGTAKVRVCKVAFQKLHAITASKLRHIVAQSKSGMTSARCSRRGKHNNRPNRISDEQRSMVHDHIRSFPSESSHYSRSKNPNRRYLAPTLTTNLMYKDYAKRCQNNGKVPASGSAYRSIFACDFNLGFGTPRSDICSRCELITETEELRTHKQMADRAFEQQRLDRADARSGRCVYITFDLEKTLPLPKLSVSEAFYLRQLWLYNTGVHVVCNNQDRAYFNIWTEDQGRRGVNEVGSSLLNFFDVARVCGPDQSLIAWSDSCSGQNKNFGIICFWQYMILSRFFKCIHHKFPEPGHTYLDSDRDFAKVEVAVRRREFVYSVDEYQHIMANSQSKANVTRVGDKIVNIASLSVLLGLKKQTVNEVGEKIELRDKVRWIRVTEFGKYDYRHSLSEDEPWKTVILGDFRSSNLPTAPELVLQPRKLPVNAAKLTDIRKQLKYIPAQYQALYLSLSSDDMQRSVALDGEHEGELTADVSR